MSTQSTGKGERPDGLDEMIAYINNNPIDYTNFEQLADDCWLFLTNDKCPTKATIKKEAFIHEVKTMIKSAVEFNCQPAPSWEGAEAIGEVVSKAEYDDALNKIEQLREQLKNTQQELVDAYRDKRYYRDR